MTKNRWLALIVGGAILSWVVIIIASGLGWNPLSISWDFSNSGTFGDSFGPLSAMMAGAAAVSAFAALQSQQSELRRLRLREASEDRRNQKSDFERTFFQLLQSFRDIVSSIDVENNSGQVKSGQDAFKSMIYTYGTRYKGGSKEGWDFTYKRYRNDLGHYFRFLYHLVSFVDTYKGIDSYFYIRLVRASLSDSEILLLALNCAYGEGYEKFKPLAEKYALLHNASEENREVFKLDSLFATSAFMRKRPTKSSESAA